MIETLLFAVRDALRKPAFGFDARTCDIRVDGRPTPICGDIYLAIHQAPSSSDMDNALDEYFAFDLTLTYRVKVPLDRVGDQQLAAKLASQPGPRGQLSLNRRLEGLRSFLHMNWLLLSDANTLLVNWNATAFGVSGFAEPARYIGTEWPRFETGAWFFADDAAEDVGLVGVLHFDRARRLQPIGVYV